MNNLIDQIKTISTGAVEAGKPCKVYTGEITSITPLIIKISDELSLSTQLVVTGRVQTMLNDGDLIVGNSVALLRYQGGQNFLVMDEMDATTPDDWDSMAVINLQNHMEDLIKHITPAERLLWNQNADNVPLANHIADDVRHIFDWERTAWNEAVSNIPLNNHIADNVKHVTGDERTAWAKNVVDLDTHIGDQIKHITEDERTAWTVHKNNVIIHVTNADKIKWNDHVARKDNPHAVTKAQVGLGAYPASPADIGISTATQEALDGTVKNTGDEDIAGVKNLLDCVDMGKGKTGHRELSFHNDAVGNTYEDIVGGATGYLGGIYGKPADGSNTHMLVCHTGADNSKVQLTIRRPSTRNARLTTNWYLYVNSEGDSWITQPMRSSPGSSDAVNVKYVLDQVEGMVDYIEGEVGTHEARKNNPHAVTKAQVGLGAYPTSPADIGISTATQTALNAKQDKLTFATEAEAIGGSNNTTLMTPLRVEQAFDEKFKVIDGVLNVFENGEWVQYEPK